MCQKIVHFLLILTLDNPTTPLTWHTTIYFIIMLSLKLTNCKKFLFSLFRYLIVYILISLCYGTILFSIFILLILVFSCLFVNVFFTLCLIHLLYY